MKTPLCALKLPEEWQKLQWLSPREYQIFMLLGDGLSSREIADYPGVKCSPKTVETHYAHLKGKLGIDHICQVRVLAARFIALHGRPEIERHVYERRLIFGTAKSTL